MPSCAAGSSLLELQMPIGAIHRFVVWLLLVMYLAAGVTAQLAHEHGAVSGHTANPAALGVAPSDAGAASDDDHNHDCAACRFLAQLAHGIASPEPVEIAARVVPLHAAAPASPTRGSLLLPHSRGPPRLV